MIRAIIGESAERSRMSVARRISMKFLIWMLLNATVVVTTLMALWGLPGILRPSEDLRLVLDLSWIGIVFAAVLVVLPSALVAELRFKRRTPAKMHYVPYLGTVAYAIFIPAAVYIFFGVLLVAQVPFAVLLHVLMARQYRRASSNVKQ